MSILIKGMEMPKHISTIVFVNPDGTVNYEEKGETGFHYTTAVEIPAGHGRLIDADAAIKSLPPIEDYDFAELCTLDTAKRLVRKALQIAPTVIPADKDGER